jgi:hypothetical protein
VRSLRFLTYLSSSIPAALLELFVTEIGRRGERTMLDFKTKKSSRVRLFMPVDSFFYDSFPLLGAAAAGQGGPL